MADFGWNFLLVGSSNAVQTKKRFAKAKKEALEELFEVFGKLTKKSFRKIRN